MSSATSATAATNKIIERAVDKSELKICTRCGEAKPKEAFYWRINRVTVTGQPRANGGACKICKRALATSKRRADRTAFNAKKRTYRATDPDHFRTYEREYARKWRKEHREEYNANQRRSYARRKAAATTNIKKELDDGRTLDNA